jgi:hypothetical protein
MALYARLTAGAQRTHCNRPTGSLNVVAIAFLKPNQRPAAVGQQGNQAAENAAEPVFAETS